MQRSYSIKHYDLEFAVDLSSCTFYGKEVITCDIKKGAKAIYLDAVGLKIHECEATIGSKKIPINYQVKLREGKLVINTSKSLKPGQLKLHIEFSGVLNDSLAGFYRSSYFVRGKKKYLATTQFEATEARKAFPCVDEPVFKSTFDVSLLIDKKLQAISNMPIKEERLLGTNRKLIRFATTPLMSTYLLYLAVGEFEYLEDNYKQVSIRGYTTPGKKDYTRFAIGCTKKFLKYFEEYFDYPYTLPKLDLVAVLDFFANAMENWGAMLYRENRMLVYPGITSNDNRLRIAELIAHEIAHMWFGNLITMKKWDDLWLSESFATFMAYKAMEHVWPDWDSWSDYAVQNVFRGMAIDGLKVSHPLSVTIKKESDIGELFDDIAYGKGGGVLLMLEKHIGEENFRQALRNLIKRFQSDSFEAKDFWNCLAQHAKKDIKSIVQDYITRIGFPLVSIDTKNGVLRLKQTRFHWTSLGSKGDHAWDIPMIIHADKQPTPYVLGKKEALLPVPKAKFAFVNKDYSSFFISWYKGQVEKNVGNSFSTLTYQEKIGFIHDLLSLVVVGKKDLYESLELLNRYTISKSFEPHLAYLLDTLHSLYLLLPDAKIRDLATVITKRGLSLTGYLPRQNEIPLVSQFRNSALFWLTLIDDGSTIGHAQKRFNKYVKQNIPIHPDLRSFTYSAAIWSSDNNYETVLKLYEKEDIQEEKIRLVSALAFSKNEKTLSQTLQYLTGPSGRFSHLIYPITSLGRNPYGKNVAINWLLREWKPLVERVDGIVTGVLGTRILRAIIPICGVGNEKKVSQFIRENKNINLEKTYQQLLEEIQVNSRFFKRYS